MSIENKTLINRYAYDTLFFTLTITGSTTERKRDWKSAVPGGKSKKILEKLRDRDEEQNFIAIKAGTGHQSKFYLRENPGPGRHSRSINFPWARHNCFWAPYFIIFYCCWPISIFFH